MFRENFELFQKIAHAYDLEIFSAFLEGGGSSESSAEIEIEETLSGDPTVKYKGRYLHSRRDPLRESIRLIDSGYVDGYDTWVFAGFGLGYHIEYFLKKTSNTKIIVAEHDLGLLKKVFSVRDFRSLFSSGRIIFFLSEDPKKLTETLRIAGAEKVCFFPLRGAFESDPLFYSSLKETAEKYVFRKDINSNTVKRFGKLWVRNFIKNLPLFAETPGISELENICAGFPALILAAGPELDMLLPHLKELEKKFVVVAVDTSCSAVLRNGTEPDFLIVVDPQYWNSRHLDRCRSEKTIFISESSAYPALFGNGFPKLFFAGSVFPVGRYFERFTGFRGKLGAGGSVATSAWDFAGRSGCRDIVFAGLDLGFPEKRTHAAGTFFEERAAVISYRLSPCSQMDYDLFHSSEIFAAENNEGGLTWTDERLMVYKWWFQEQLVFYPERKTKNASPKGIKIDGMETVSLKELLAYPDIYEKKRARLEALDYDALRKKWNNRKRIKDAAERLASLLKDYREIAAEGLEITDRIVGSEGDEQLRSFQLCSEIDRRLLSGEAKDIIGFLLQSTGREIIIHPEVSDFKTVIENTRQLYGGIIFSADYYGKILRKGIAAL